MLGWVEIDPPEVGLARTGVEEEGLEVAVHAGVDREESAPNVGYGFHEVAERGRGHGRQLCDGDLSGNDLHGSMFAAPRVPRKPKRRCRVAERA